ncbi:hypothetical protein EWU23_12060 [Cytophagaceae bacterium 50C-KIRBA]|uniref:Uracil-DNA glycosylase-like domain-containing protein n=1 Tax=Aquirufa beregesia TaxID=2516556 RepID=A0ABX0F5S6_9BACT|nr:hypothetical protein [Aquirufa beregesia]NGZ45210.1 hypothetical protein [Aquirufa beregesia]
MMASDRIDLAELYKFDEIYWIPADRPAIPSEAPFTPRETPQSTLEVELPSAKTSVVEGKVSIPVQEKPSAPSGPGLQASLIDEVKSIEPKVLQELPIVTCRLVVVGKINPTEKERLQLVLSAAPVSLQPSDWQVLEPTDSFSLSEFVEGTQAQIYVFLGDQIPAWKEQLPEGKISQIGNNAIYYFPRYISSLKDSEKPLKLAFWNSVKEIINYNL